MADRPPTGFHAAAADRAESRVDLQARFVPHPHATFLVRCVSEALVGRSILPGDLCLVDRSLEARPGDVVIATATDEVLIRVFEGNQGGPPVLVGDPPQGPIRIDAEAGVEVWGVVTAVIRQLR